MISWDSGESGDMYELMKITMMSVPLKRDYKRGEKENKGVFWLRKHWGEALGKRGKNTGK